MSDRINQWEESFKNLDKAYFSAEALGGYDLRRYFKKYTTNQSHILDFGCGMGNSVQNLIRSGYLNTFGTDPSIILVGESPLLGQHIKLMENNTIPFESNFFDLVFCSGVLHHIEWDVLKFTLSEIYRVLKPNGYFIYNEPRYSTLRKIGHLLVFSPLSKVSKNIRILRQCLDAEWNTYIPWMKKEKYEFSNLCKINKFSFIERNNLLLTTVAVLKKTP